MLNRTALLAHLIDIKAGGMGVSLTETRNEFLEYTDAEFHKSIRYIWANQEQFE